MHSTGLLALALSLASPPRLPVPPAPAEKPATPGPCEELVVYLHNESAGGGVPRLALPHGPAYHEQETELEGTLRSLYATAPRELADRVTPACRAAIRREEAPEAVAAARALTQRREPGWIDRGRVFLCAMQDPASLGEVAAWIDDPQSPAAQAVCVTELASWPAEALRASIMARALRKDTFGWQINPAVVAAANAMGSPELREALVPVLASANAHHALGYDRLRDGVCTDDGAMSSERTQACSILPVEEEAVWPQSEPTRRWLAKGAATALFAGAVTAAALERHQEAGRAIATAAGVPLGAMVGLAGGAHDPSREPMSTGLKVCTAIGVVIGGAAGATAAYALAAKPSNRATVTALALAPAYLITMITFSAD